MASLRRVRAATFTLFVVLTVSFFVFAERGYSQQLATQGQSPSIVINGDPPPSKVGRWQTVVPLANGGAIGEVLGMQTVHAVLLPSGRILLASGSSWRNLGPIKTFPTTNPPPTPKGIFDRALDPFANSKLSWYYQLVNNTAIYDPEKNTFFRIPSPVPHQDPTETHFMPSDLFCTGEHHLPNGNVLFAGGTQYYYPYRTGQNSTFIFDWKKELQIPWDRVDWRQLPSEATNPWTFAGFMKRGRWYPSMVPLLDGRFAVFGGYVGFDKDFPDMYKFQLNHYVELFDPTAWSKAEPQKAWKAIDVHTHPNSPFVTLINPNFDPKNCAAGPTYDDCVRTNRYDNFKLYPENYLMPDGNILLTREGDWVSLRTEDTAFMRRTKHTYFARIEGTRDNPSISFKPGPDRPEDVTSYGTSLLDPNTGLVTILGGQPTSAGTLFPFNSTPYQISAMPYQFAGGRGSRKRETFDPSAGGRWKLEPDFLGTEPQDDRTMHYALILPTRQILVINGGNYDFYGAVYYPLLLTPQFAANGTFSGYSKERMSEGMQPRLYHNVALLMPDARVWVSGGNSTRATVYSTPMPEPEHNFSSGQPKPDLSAIDVDNYFYGDGPIGKLQKGAVQVPTEDWIAEIFEPPYLFIDPARRPTIRSIESTQSTPYTTRETLGGKPYYLWHANDMFEIALGDLPSEPCTTSASLALIKLPSPTHGWDGGQRFVPLPFSTVTGGKSVRVVAPDLKKQNLPPAFYMLFYVDCRGKPTVAEMVRLDDSAKRPLE